MNNDEEKLPTSEPVRAGYRNPPQHTRFKKGQSGNPKGRPKGSLNLATVLAKTLREKVIIHEQGQRKVVTKLEAASTKQPPVIWRRRASYQPSCNPPRSRQQKCRQPMLP